MASIEPELHDVASALGAICDPELPPVTLADLGILRAVRHDGDRVVVTITPTYSGCPAMATIEADIAEVAARHGHDDIVVERRLDPPWTTDWITTAGRRKLREQGIAPPRPLGEGGDGSVPVQLGRKSVACPRCGSAATTLVSRFGSTACKSLYRCDGCGEPFDHFKEY